MMEIIPLTAFNDNYIWLLKNEQTKQCAVVDPGDAKPVLSWLANNPEWQLNTILITHHHADHIGGIEELKQATSATVFAPDNPAITTKDHIVNHQQIISVLGFQVEIIAVPGHTLDHVAYYFPAQQNIAAQLFSGDTLFVAGCGRIFEGTIKQMYQSLQLLAALPPETLVYCAHEYTLNNLNFAATVEPSNQKITQFFKQCLKKFEEAKPTVPSTILLEQQINPFLRCAVTEIVKSTESFKQQPIDSEEKVFGALREWKNIF